MKEYPIQCYSWTVLSEHVLTKTLDKSAYLHHGTGIPKGIYEYWQIDGSKNRVIRVQYENIQYGMRIVKDRRNRYRLFWHSDFSAIIKSKYSEQYNLYKNDIDSDDKIELRFTIFDNNRVVIDFVESVMNIDIEVVSDICSEGRAIYYYGTRYERSKEAREIALILHGYNCLACGFNFEHKYGTWGKGFIEVHHTKPIYLNAQEQIIDPQSDLVTICSNCHRMVHRKKHNVLSVRQLSGIINENGNNYISDHIQ